MMRRRRPLHFLLLGAALFALGRCVRPELVEGRPSTGSGRTDAAPPQPIGRDPESVDAALWRAARARGLERTDPVVRQRLIRNMRFVAGGRDDAALYRDALALGLADSDEVVRRRLVAVMRRTLEAPAWTDEPSDAALQAYLTAHGERFARPPRVRLSQIYLSRARRGAALDADARRLLTRLAPDDVAHAAALGDPLPVPAHLPLSADADLARLLGPAFAHAALA
ncbi:MAG: hypothetical protein ACRERC_25915, partial [Candidatus Binatia bacterium]